MTQAIAKVETAVELEYSVEQVTALVQKIQQIMRAAMRKDEHCGVIPGTDKPSLLKPSAEKLCLTFRLAPRYFGEDMPKDLGRGLSSLTGGAQISNLFDSEDRCPPFLCVMAKLEF